MSRKKISALIYITAAIMMSVFLALSAYQLYEFSKSKEHIISFDPIKLQQISQDNEGMLNGLSFPEGDYTLEILYSASGDGARASLGIEKEDGDIMVPLPSTKGEIMPAYIDFSCAYPVASGRLTINCDEGVSVSVISLKLLSDRSIYTDSLINAAVFILLIVVTMLLTYKIKHGADPVVIGVLLLMFAATTFPIIFRRALPISGDLRGHLMRIEGIMFGLKDGQFPVVIYPEWNNRHGQLGILYPSLFLYPAAILRMLRVSLLNASKLMFVIINALSCYIYYKAAKAVFEKRWMQLLTVFLLIFEYTRMYGVTYGGKLGGALISEMFAPLVVAGVIDLFYKEGKKWHYIAVGLAGVFCSHIITSVVAVFVIMLISAINVRKMANPSVRSGIIKAILLFVLLTLGTYVAFLRYYFVDWSSNYLTWRDFVGDLSDINAFFADRRWAHPFVLLIIGVILYGMAFFKKKKIGGSVIFVAFMLFLMATDYFPWVLLRRIDAVKSLTDLLQSGNRFLNMSSVLSSFGIPFLLDEVFDNNRYKKMIICCVSAVLVAFSLRGALYAFKNIGYSGLFITDKLVADIYYDNNDYLPQGTITDYYRSDAGYISDESVITTLGYERYGTHVNYLYMASRGGEYVEFPLFYYEGYEANDADGSVEIEKSDRNKILINIPESNKERGISLRYAVPKYITFLYMVSIIAWMALPLALKRRSYRNNT